MTHHTSWGVAVLVGVMYLGFAGSVMLISHALAAQTHDPLHAVPHLIKALQDEDVDARYVAAQALGQIGPTAHTAVPALIVALKDKNLAVRWAATQALGKIGPTAVPHLIKALQDENPTARGKAAEVLGKIGPTANAAVPTLIEALQDETPTDRGTYMFFEITDLMDELTLKEALQDEKPSVRENAAQALEKIGLTAVPALIQALKDQNFTARVVAAQVLGKMGPPANPAVPALIKAMKDKNTDVRGTAAQVLGKIGPPANAVVPALIEALTDESPTVRTSAAETLATIALTVRDARATQMISPLKAARNALMALADPRLHEQAATVSWVVEFLELLWWRNLREKLWQWLVEHPYLSAAMVIYPLLLWYWLALHWLRPLWLYRINEALKPYTDLALPAQLGGIKIPLRYVILVGFFHYSRRMLNAWVTQHLTTAKEEFQRKATVSDRAVHIPVPVVLDGQAIPHLSAEQLRPTFNKTLACLLIWGEGGAGKTSLACQVARWAMVDRPTERLCPQHCMLPVLIEQALELKDKDHPHPFTDAIRGELRALTHEEDPIPEELLLRLLQRRRVLVIVDHFSEMPEATRQEIRPGQPDFPANALIITSRLEEQLGGVPPTTVKPLRIQGNRLSSFLEAYLTPRGKREYFDDAEFFEACRRLSLMVGTRDITVLLAKLYAEQMIATKEGPAESILPDTIPDLMLSYVNEVNRGVDRPKQADRMVHHVIKVIAWECLKRTYRPTPAPREDVLAALRGEQDAEALLSYLEDRLRLIQTVGAGLNQIRFALDPLAEYLAGLYVVQAYGDNVDAWGLFFARAEALPGAPEAIRGFLLAVRDCCLAQGADAKVPAIIMEELVKRAGVEGDAIQLNPA